MGERIRNAGVLLILDAFQGTGICAFWLVKPQYWLDDASNMQIALQWTIRRNKFVLLTLRLAHYIYSLVSAYQ